MSRLSKADSVCVQSSPFLFIFVLKKNLEHVDIINLKMFFSRWRTWHAMHFKRMWMRSGFPVQNAQKASSRGRSWKPTSEVSTPKKSRTSAGLRFSFSEQQLMYFVKVPLWNEGKWKRKSEEAREEQTQYGFVIMMQMEKERTHCRKRRLKTTCHRLQYL